EAPQPRRHVEVGVPGAAPVPVDEDGVAVAEAQVVAADVEMEQVFAVRADSIGGREQCWQRSFQPSLRADLRGEEWARIFCDDLPTPEQPGEGLSHRSCAGRGQRDGEFSEG